MVSKLFLYCLLTALLSGCIYAQKQPATKFDEFVDIGCEDELARIDNFVSTLKAQPDSIGYIIVYIGARGSYRNEMSVCVVRVQKYVTRHHGKAVADRIGIEGGGPRERPTIEMWLTRKGEAKPVATPTIAAKDVHYKKGRYIVTCAYFY